MAKRYGKIDHCPNCGITIDGKKHKGNVFDKVTCFPDVIGTCLHTDSSPTLANAPLYDDPKYGNPTNRYGFVNINQAHENEQFNKDWDEYFANHSEVTAWQCRNCNYKIKKRKYSRKGKRYAEHNALVDYMNELLANMEE